MHSVRLRVVGAAGQRLINSPQHLRGALVACANNNAVGVQKIFDRRAFTQEFRVRDHVEALRLYSMAMQHAANPVVGVNRNRALLHDHLVAFDGARNLRHHRLNVGQVGGSAVALRRAHRNEHRLALLHGLAQVRSERHIAAAMLFEQLGQVLFKDRHAPLAELLYSGFVVVYTNNLVAHVRKTSGRHQPYISRPDHAN